MAVNELFARATRKLVAKGTTLGLERAAETVRRRGGEPLAVVLPNGSRIDFGQAPRVVLTVRDDETLAALAKPSLGTLGAAFVEGGIDIDGDMAEVLYRERMSILAYSPLAGGMLTGKYAGGAKPAGTRYTRFDTIGQRYRKPMVAEAIDAYARLAASRGLTLVELALGYVTSRWFVGATIIGATSLAQLNDVSGTISWRLVRFQ